MTDFWSYRAEDFLLFSPEVYRRLFALHNESYWWVPALAFLLSLPLAMAGRERGGALLPSLLGAWLGWTWAGLGAAFFLDSYAAINWAASYLAPLFFVGGACLLAASLLRQLGWRQEPLARIAGGVLLLLGLLAVPLAELLFMGKALSAASLPFLAPDPTVFASLGLLLLAGRGWLCRGAFLLALAWCGITWLTLDTLAIREALFPPIALGLSFAGALSILLQRTSKRAAP